MSLSDMQTSIDILFGNQIVLKNLFKIFIFVDLILKGFALWKAARLNEKNWFVALLIVNSMGIFPAGYLYWKRNTKTNDLIVTSPNRF